jgi:hypothetical protein
MELNYTAPAAPSITSSAMLVELMISVWTGKKRDKAASEEVSRNKNADKGVASVNKKLLGDCAELDALQKFSANVRNMHYNATLPWSDMGPRLLTTTRYFKYNADFTALQAEFGRLVDTFLAAYDWEIMQSQAKLGDLFDVTEYPSGDDLRNKFRFKLNYIPLPDAGDWRIDIGNEAQTVLRDQYSTYYTEQLASAMNDVWRRLFDTLTTLSRQLADQTEDGKTPKIYASVFDRALEIVDMMDTCNVTNDPSMQLMQRKLAMAFRGVTVESVKDDNFLRRETKRAVDEAIKSLPSLGF